MLLSLSLISCSNPADKDKTIANEQAFVDSLLAFYQDTIPVNPLVVSTALEKARQTLKDNISSNKLLLYIAKCNYYSNQLEQAFLQNRQVLDFCEKETFSPRLPELQGDAYSSRGVFFSETGQRDSAIWCLHKAVEALSTISNPEIPIVYMNLADCYSQNGNYSECGYYYRKALWEAQSLGPDNIYMFPIFSGLAKLYLELDNFEEADYYFKEAEKVNGKATLYDQYYFAMARGNYYYNTKEYEQALIWFRKADIITSSFPYPIYKAIVEGNLGEIFILSEQADSAHYYLDRSKELFGQAYNQPSFRFYMNGLYASLALLEGNLKEAEKILSEPYDTAEINPQYLYYHNRRMQDLSMKKHDYKEAYLYRDKADAYNDSLRNVKIKNSLAEIDFRYRQDTTLLKKDILLAGVKSEAGRWRIVAVMSILILLLSLSVLAYIILYRRRRREKLYQKQMSVITGLRMENVRNRISPHYVFNVLNVILPAFKQYKELEQPIWQLIRVLRGNLLSSEKIAVPLEKEISLVKDYLQLRMMGTPEQIQINWDISSEVVSDLLIPAMCIQIPVENAVKHAFEPDEPNACLTIRIKKKDNTAVISIEDNGSGFNPRPGENNSKSTGNGIKILYQTIELLNTNNKNKMDFNIQDRRTLSPDSHGTLVSIIVPFEYNFNI